MSVYVFDMEPIETEFVNAAGLKILAFFSAEVDDLILAQGCQLMQTRRGGHKVHWPQSRGLAYSDKHGASCRGPMAGVRMLDPSMDREAEEKAVSAYKEAVKKRQQAA
jgi:hypothetical protein